MTGVEAGSGADQPTAESSAGRVDRFRAVAGMVVIVAVGAAAGFAIYRDRHSFVVTLQREGFWPIAASFLCGLAGVAAGYPMWREVLRGLGVELPWSAGARVFFTSQLGKYLPGSVWPVVMQMEAARAYGAKRRTVLGGNLITLVLSCSIGLCVASVLLPVYDRHALARYRWGLLALPFLLALLHPRALPAILDRVFALLRRPPLGETIDVRSELRAAGWSLVTWVGLGAQLVLLCVGIGDGGVGTLLLCIGGMALAVPLGVLFIPAPAGAGVRDVVLTLVLASVMPYGQALAIVITSRVILIGCDVALAAMVAVIRPSLSAGVPPNPTAARPSLKP